MLREAIRSALNQTVRDLEVILVLDGSPPETIEVTNEFRHHPRVRIFSFPTQSGTAVRGRNKGILEARGEFIAFLDSDDVADPRRLELSLPALISGEADVVYGAYRIIMAGTRIIEEIFDQQIVHSPDADFNMLQQICVPCQSTVTVRRKQFDGVGFIKPWMRYREDHELWLRLAYRGSRFKSLPYVLGQLRLHAGNNELNFKDEDAKWEKLVASEYETPGPFPKKIAFILPGVSIGGGVAVVFKHAEMLMAEGHDVSVINIGAPGDGSWFPANPVPIIHILDERRYLFEKIDILFATAWSTVAFMEVIPSKRRIYFVQSDERRFYDDSDSVAQAHQTYLVDCEYATMARWLQEWLQEEFGRVAALIPNGLDPRLFHPNDGIEAKRPDRLRVLIEGPIAVPFKGMDDAYEAIRSLDCEKWIVSSAGMPKEHWEFDRFFYQVPLAEMSKIYSSCDIFLKMSSIESFCYPVMEAMACGCAVVAAKVAGLDEYVVCGVNALVVEQKDVKGAREAIQRLLHDRELRERLISAGLETVKAWDWRRSAAAMLDLITDGQPGG